MKKPLLYFISTALVLLSACNQDKIDNLNKENSELSKLTQTKEESIEDMLGSFNQIQENLKKTSRYYPSRSEWRKHWKYCRQYKL